MDLCHTTQARALLQARLALVSPSFHAPSSVDPKPYCAIDQMVSDGTEGTTQGPGYVQYLNGGSSYTYTQCPLGYVQFDVTLHA